jgi:hemin uptake protein HemP
MLGSDAERDGDAGDPPRPARNARTSAAGAQAAVRTVEAASLLGPGGVLRIDLDGEIYTLRLTRNHRLILTK